MGKEQICPFSLKAELIGIWNSIQRGTPPLPERLKGTVDNLRSLRKETQDPLAYSVWGYQEGVDRRGQPDLIHPRFGSMTDSLLRFVTIQNSPEGRKIAKTQLRQWLLIKEAALELKDGGEIYVLVPKIIEIEDGVALMRLRKDGDYFLAQSRLLSQDFEQEKVHLLFEKFKEKGLVIKDLTSDEPSLIFRIAKGEKENSVDLKADLPQILTELSRPVLAQEFRESQIPRPLAEFSPSISLSLFELVLPKEGEIYQSSLEKPKPEIAREGVVTLPQSKGEKPRSVAKTMERRRQIDKVEFSLNQSEISVTHKSSLHNLQRSQENVQLASIERSAFIKEGQPVEEKEEIFVDEEQAFIEKERQPFLASLGGQISLDMKQQEMVVEVAKQPMKGKERLIFVRGREAEKSVALGQSSEELLPKEPVEKEIVVAEREEVVVFEAPEPTAEVTTSVTQPFAFIRNEPRIEEKMVSEIVTLQLLPQVEEVVLPVLVVSSFGRAEQTVHVEGETSQDVMPRVPRKRHKKWHKNAEAGEERVALPKVEVWTPKIVHLNFPLSLFSPRRWEGKREKFFDQVLRFEKRRNPSWIELIPPKETSIIAALARDNFGINNPNSSATLTDLTLFWLLGMSLFAQKPTLYKLELDFTPLTVKVKDGKILVARRVIPEEILGRESLRAEWRQFLPRPFLFLTA